MASPSSTTTEAKPTLTVDVSHNGMNAAFQYRSEELAERVRVLALDHYEIHGPARDQEFLFGPDNQTEIRDGATMGSQVTPGSQLYLRRREQGGGGSR